MESLFSILIGSTNNNYQLGFLLVRSTIGSFFVFFLETAKTMKISSYFIVTLSAILLSLNFVRANTINATPSNYTTYLGSLMPGDTLKLAAGTYTGNLTLNNRNGTATQPIVIMGVGNSTNFQGQSCCNTVSITKCSYLVIRQLQLDGMGEAIDAVKAEGTIGNKAHHITIEYLNIINYGSDQQNVGISTKCPAWDWIIRKNKIIGAGTGLYLGNSNGDDPFVNGVIEYNYIANTVGYNMEIKHQLNGVRDTFPETQVNGKTTIRYNVFTKDNTSSNGGNARPNVLVGGFPSSGWGAQDYYELYGNFFYNNPVEALFQGTGNVMMYENIFVNHFDPPGLRAVYFTPHNGVSPQNIKVFHNTLWAMNSSGGIRLNSPNTSFQQYCVGNAAFAPTAISGFTNSTDNVTDVYANASTYVLAATTNINTLDLYPKLSQLTGTLTPNTTFNTQTDWNKDFNNATYNWTYRGAYSGCCTNPGWHLELDTMTTHIPTGAGFVTGAKKEVVIYPSPCSDRIYIETSVTEPMYIEIFSISGQKMLSVKSVGPSTLVDVGNIPPGVYFVKLSCLGITTVQVLTKM